MKIGFIGLGNMGAAVARNLLDAGHDLTVWNRSTDKAAPLVEAGATLAASPAEAALGDVVVTMLADDHAVEAVVHGDQGIASTKTGTIHVSMSTISPGLARRLAAISPDGYVAAPVFGRPAAAAAAKLFILASGAPEAITRCQPVFDVIGQRTFVVGDNPEAANVVKLCGNFMIMATVESLGEAMALAGKHGIERGKLLEILTSTLFGAPVVQTYGPMLVEEAFRPAGFAAPLGLKDMNLVAATATEARVAMPALSMVRDRLLATIAQEGDDIDWAGIGKTIFDDAGR